MPHFQKLDGYLTDQLAASPIQPVHVQEVIDADRPDATDGVVMPKHLDQLLGLRLLDRHGTVHRDIIDVDKRDPGGVGEHSDRFQKSNVPNRARVEWKIVVLLHHDNVDPLHDGTAPGISVQHVDQRGKVNLPVPVRNQRGHDVIVRDGRLVDGGPLSVHRDLSPVVNRQILRWSVPEMLFHFHSSEPARVTLSIQRHTVS